MNQPFFKQVIVGVVIATTVAACSFHTDKGGQSNAPANNIFVDVNGRISIPAGKAPGYLTVKALVFQNRCIECHGRRGGVNLETYAAALSALAEIKQTVVVEQTMPPRGALSFEEQQLVRAWIDAGAPENDISIATGEPLPSATPDATPLPTPQPTPVVDPSPTPDLPVPAATPFGIVRYADVENTIFAAKCTRCHSDTRAAGGVNLANYDNVILNLKAVEDEALVTLSMPPKNKPLLINEQTLLRAWIDQGAQK